jgi:hypothetical protein
MITVKGRKVGEVTMKEYIVMAILQETIDAFDARNAPELVRCKDCAYALFKEGAVQPGHIVCTKPFTERWQAVKPNDWFCADGKVGKAE